VSLIPSIAVFNDSIYEVALSIFNLTGILDASAFNALRAVVAALVSSDADVEDVYLLPPLRKLETALIAPPTAFLAF